LADLFFTLSPIASHAEAYLPPCPRLNRLFLYSTGSLCPRLGGVHGGEGRDYALPRAEQHRLGIASLFTRAEWGPIRFMPCKAYLAIDTLGGLTALTAPWLFGFAKTRKARNTFLVTGVFALVAGLLSQPDEMPDHSQPLGN
jgi:hypothetical protein